MDIGIIGAGRVAQAFARHALKVGHTMKISNSRGPSTLGPNLAKLQIVANETQRAPQQS